MAAKDASSMVAPASQGSARSETPRARCTSAQSGASGAEKHADQHGDQGQHAATKALVEQQRQRKAYDGGNGQGENRREGGRLRTEDQQQSGEGCGAGGGQQDVADAGDSRGEGDGEQRPPNPSARPQAEKSGTRGKAQRGEREQHDGQRPEGDLRGMRVCGPGNGHGASFAQNEAQKKRENGDGENGDRPGEKSPEKFRAGEEFFVKQPGDFEQQEKYGRQGDRDGASGGPVDGPSAKEIEIDRLGFGRIGNIGVGEGIERS